MLLILLMHWCTGALMGWCCWCADAAYAGDALMLLLFWYCWCTDAADALILLRCWCCLCCWCDDAADALMHWCCWCADAADSLMLLMRWCYWCADAAAALMLVMCWCTDATDAKMLLMQRCFWCYKYLHNNFCTFVEFSDHSIMFDFALPSPSDFMISYILKVGLAGWKNPQMILNFPQKDCLRMRKVSR